MDFKQWLVTGSTIGGWVLLAAFGIFTAVIFYKLYSSRDKEAGAERKKLEEEAKAAKKLAKKSKNEPRDSTDTNKKNRLKTAATAPKRQEVVSRIAEATRPSVSAPMPNSANKAANTDLMKDFMNDDIDEFALAKRKALGKPTNSDSSAESKPKGFPPPPPRL